MTANKNDARKIINALKNGVPPAIHPSSISTGRDRELEEMESCMDMISEGSGIFKIITGAYGSGKTFLMQHTKEIALEKGFIVSTITVDRSFKLNKLDDFYYYIMHNLYMEKANEKISFAEIFDIWISNLKHAPTGNQVATEINTVISTLDKYSATFSRAFYLYIKAQIAGNQEEMHVLSSWITGEKQIPHELKQKYSLVGKVEKTDTIDFLKGFSELVTLLGYPGLIILIDELDLIINERKDIRLNAYNNIKHLLDLSTGSMQYPIMFMLSGTDQLMTDEEKGFKQCDALAQRLGMDVHNYTSKSKDVRLPVITLGTIAFHDLIHITEKVYALYKTAYNLKMDISLESLKNWALIEFHQSKIDIKNLRTRDFIIKLTSVLDVIEQKQHKHIYNTELHLIEQDGSILFKNRL